MEDIKNQVAKAFHHCCSGEALSITNKAVVEALDGLPAHKLHCSVLAEEAIKAALKDYYDKNEIEYDHTQFPDCESCGHCCEL